MRYFRKPLYFSGEISAKVKRGKYGIDGFLCCLNREVVVRYDLSKNYQIENKVFNIKLEEEYAPKKHSDYHVGIDNVADSYMSTRILEKDVTSDIVIDGWSQYADSIHLNKIIKYLVARDVCLFKLGNYFLKPGLNYGAVTPSWDVCISLAAYLKLCENIGNFETRLHEATEMGDQIRGNFQKLNGEIIKGTFVQVHASRLMISEHLDQLLRSLHTLNDELELAYNLAKVGYDVEFGERGEPDYIIGNIPAEQKSRFPEFDQIVKEKKSTSFQYAEALEDLVREIKKSRKALSEAEIYFCNLSRLETALTFYAATELEKIDEFTRFDNMMKRAFTVLEKERVVIPYLKLYSFDPKILGLPIPKNINKLIQREKTQRK